MSYSDSVSVNEENMVQKAKSKFRRLDWLGPIKSLFSESSTAFGRNIEKELNNLSQHRGVMKLQLRKQDKAVVISIERYEEMIKMKNAYAQLLESEMTKSIEKATDEYEQLYCQITSPQTRVAADALFEVSEEQLSETFQPGKTENK